MKHSIIRNQQFISEFVSQFHLFYNLFYFVLVPAPFQKCLVQYCALDSQFSAALLDWINSDDMFRNQK